MGIAARELSLYVIRPTLAYLGLHNPNAETLLLGIAASQSKLGAALHDRRGHGLYCIREPRHAALWDNYLDTLWHKGKRGGKGVMILWFAQGLGECNEVADSFLHWM